MRESRDILIKPIVSEKSVKEMENGKYSFWVHINTNKLQIRKAVSDIFKVKVKDVNIQINKGKRRMTRGIIGKTKDRKKAIVTLESGQKIEIFEGT